MMIKERAFVLMKVYLQVSLLTTAMLFFCGDVECMQGFKIRVSQVVTEYGKLESHSATRTVIAAPVHGTLRHSSWYSSLLYTSHFLVIIFSQNVS